MPKFIKQTVNNNDPNTPQDADWANGLQNRIADAVDPLVDKTQNISADGLTADFPALKQDGFGVLDDRYKPTRESLMMQIATSTAGNVSRASAQYENVRVPFGSTNMAQSLNSFTISSGLFTAKRNMKLLVNALLTCNITTGGDGLLVLKSRKNGAEYNRSTQAVVGGKFYSVPICFEISLNSGDTLDLAYEWDGAKTTLLYYASSINITELF